MYIEEAIKELKSEVNDSKECRYIDLVGDECVEFFQLIETLLTAYEKEKEKNKKLEDTLKCTQNSWYEDTKVIEKQQKEIEELKDKCKELYNPSDMILRYYDTKKGTQVEIKGFVPTDKIKAKIEEYENKIKKIRSKKLINEPEDTIVITRYAHYISVLQSLLEKGVAIWKNL